MIEFDRAAKSKSTAKVSSGNIKLSIALRPKDRLMGTMSLRTLCYNEHPGSFGFIFCEYYF
jgi:hypothetical protein